jgi:WD40 repeat protein
MVQPITQANLITRSNDITGDGNFTQGCKFSPDGLCVLTSTAADNILRLYNTPVDLQQQPQESSQPFNDSNASSWKSVLSIKGGDSVRSYCWYPLMNSHLPATCAFVASCRYVLRLDHVAFLFLFCLSSTYSC